MSDEGTRKLPGALARLLGRYRRRAKSVGAFTGVFLTLAASVMLVAVAVSADRLLRLDMSVRIAILGVIGLVVAALVGWEVLRPAFKKITQLRAAAKLGEHYPEMKEDLLTAVELSTSERAGQGVSPGLIASAVAGISARAETLDPRKAVSARRMVKVAVVFVALAAGLEGAYLVRPEAVGNALQRLFTPNRAVPYFSYTRVEVKPGDVIRRMGDKVELTVATSGREVKTATLQTKNGGGVMNTPMELSAGQGNWTSAPLFEDLRYRVRAGDGLTEWHTVRVLPPPAVEKRGAIVRDPAYAEGAQHVMKDVQGALEIIQGSEVVLRVLPVRRGTDSKLACAGSMTFEGEEQDLTTDAEGWLGTKPFSSAKSGERVFRLTDGYGLTNAGSEGMFIKVVPDELPKVAVTSPGRDIFVLPMERVKVETMAQDDLGLRALGIAYRKAGAKDERSAGPWSRRALEPGGTTVRTLKGATTLSVGEMGLEPGESMEYRAESSDFAGDDVERLACSVTYRISVISESDHLRQVLEKLRDVRMELLATAARERAEAAAVGEMAKHTKDGSKNEDARLAEERQKELMRATEAAARKVEALIAELMRNPSASEKMLADLEHLGRSVRGVAQNPEAKAADKLGEASKTESSDSGKEQQAGMMGEAKESQLKAASDLEDLAKMADRLGRSGILEQLAQEAERLAARQKEIAAESAVVGVKTAGMAKEDLKDELKTLVDRVAAGEEGVRSGVERLGKEMDKAAGELMHTKPDDAATVEEAGQKLRGDKVPETTADLVKQLGNNVMFATTPTQEKVAASLKEVAAILRKGADKETMQAVARELERFIKRQTEINGNTQKAIDKTKDAMSGATLGGRQMGLERDVSEQASALSWLAEEVEFVKSETAEKLKAAADEMKDGGMSLYRTDFADGLEYGKKALALLKEAQDKLKEEADKMGGGGKGEMSPEQLRAMLLMMKVLMGQKEVLEGTGEADMMPKAETEGFAKALVGLVAKQSAVRVDTGRLQEMLQQYEQMAEVVALAGGKMDVSRLGLENGDAGKETREVQRQAIALLEALMKEAKGKMGGKGLAGMRMQAMMQMMQGRGNSPGGNPNGGNAPILPARLGEADDSGWRKVHSRFEDELGGGFEGNYPPEFRGLLDAYFDRLRKEPNR